MSNVETIEFLINEANQLTADTPKKVCKYVIGLLTKAAQEVAGSNANVKFKIEYRDTDEYPYWHITCSGISGTSYVTLADKSYPALNYWTVASAGWDNAAEVFVEAIELVSQNIQPSIPTIQESLNVSNGPKFDPPKFDPEQAIWDAGGWVMSDDYEVLMVGPNVSALVKFSSGIVEALKLTPHAGPRSLSHVNFLVHPRQVRPNHSVLAVLPNGVYVAKRKDREGYWTVSTNYENFGYTHYDNAVKDAIKFSQENS